MISHRHRFITLAACAWLGCFEGSPSSGREWRIALDRDGAIREQPSEKASERELDLGFAAAAEQIEKRVAELEVPAKVTLGGRDELEVQLPHDIEAGRARAFLTRRCRFALHDVLDADPREASLRERYPDGLPEGSEILVQRAPEEHFLLSTRPFLAPQRLVSAEIDLGSGGVPNVAIQLDEEGGRIMRSATTERIGKRVAILIDREVFAGPVVRATTGSHAVIDGRFSMEEAWDLALCLRNGPLPVPVRILSERTFGGPS